MNLSRRRFLFTAPAIVAATTIMPISVQAFLAPKSPLPGFVPCNGQWLDRYDYTHLFDAIGYAYGKGPIGNTFRVPDLRGSMTEPHHVPRHRPANLAFNIQPAQIVEHFLVAQPRRTLPAGSIIVGTPEFEQARIPLDDVGRFTKTLGVGIDREEMAKVYKRERYARALAEAERLQALQSIRSQVDD